MRAQGWERCEGEVVVLIDIRSSVERSVMCMSTTINGS